MALTYGFYNSLNGDRKYNAEQFGSIFDGVITDGVYMGVGDHMIVKPGYDMTVFIQTGRAWFNHTWTLNDTVYPIQVPASLPLLDRYAVVYLEVNQEVEWRRNSFGCIAGEGSQNPQKPTLTNNQYVHQYPLAYILIPAGATVITSSMIENTVGTTACPFVSGVVQTMNIDDLIAQWSSQWQDYMDARSQQWAEFYDPTVNSWNTFFENAQTDWTNFKTSKESDWSNFKANKNSDWDAFKAPKEEEWGTFYSGANTTWTNKLDDYDRSFNDKMESIDNWYSGTRTDVDEMKADFESFSRDAQNEWSGFVSDCQGEFDGLMRETERNAENLIYQTETHFNEVTQNLEADYQSFWQPFKRDMQEYLLEQERIWQAWFERIQGQLTEDAATHLQQQIDALAYAYVYNNRAILGNTAFIDNDKCVFGSLATRDGNKVILRA